MNGGGGICIKYASDGWYEIGHDFDVDTWDINPRI